MSDQKKTLGAAGRGWNARGDAGRCRHKRPHEGLGFLLSRLSSGEVATLPDVSVGAEGRGDVCLFSREAAEPQGRTAS